MGLPKAQSGEIMRRILRKVIGGETTPLDPLAADGILAGKKQAGTA